MHTGTNLFAYGTLMWPHVLEAVIGRRLQGVPADLAGYRRLRVKGECYPVVIPSSNDSVAGILYTGLTSAEFESLDRFEGIEYDRQHLAVGNESAQVYVLSAGWEHITEEEEWRPEQVHPEHLQQFCREYKGWIDIY